TKSGQHEGERPQRIDVWKRIESESPAQPRRWVAESVGHESMGDLVDGDRQQQRRNLEDESLKEQQGIAKEIGHLQSCQKPPSTVAPSDGAEAGTGFGSPSHTPRSMSRQASEQNGRCGLPFQPIARLQCAQRAWLVADPSCVTAPSYRWAFTLSTCGRRPRPPRAAVSTLARSAPGWPLVDTAMPLR